MTTGQRFLIGCSVAVLLALLSWLTISPGIPQIYAPLNVAVLLPMFLIGEVVDERVAAIVACAVVPLLFCLWCWQALRGRVDLPTRSIALLVVSVLLSAAWLVLGYRVGIDYQGVTYVVGVSAINVASWAALIVLAFRAYRQPNVRHTLGFHVLLFVWLAWFVFPYLGELP